MGLSVVQLQHVAEHLLPPLQVMPDLIAIGRLVITKMHRIQSLPLGYFNL